MIISRELAQKIVDHLMVIVQRNVNIMDCSGIIIASGQSGRIDTFHQGGMLAAAEHHVVEIFPEEEHLYPGAVSGVMWPIDLKNKTVGVVGVTGEPNEVRNTAKLVKTVTELILEREMFLADYGSENRMKEQLVNLLFEDNQNTVLDDIHTLAGMLHYTLNIPRLVLVAKLESQIDANYAYDGLQNLFSDRMRESVSNLLKESDHVTSDDMSLFYKKNLVILKALPKKTDAKLIRVFVAGIASILRSVEPRLEIRIGVGSRALTESQLRHSYHEAVFALDYADPSMVRSISEFEILLNYLFIKRDVQYNSCLALMELGQILDKIQVKYDMQKTLRTLLDNNLSISDTANALFIHRNTLKFRLAKLKEVVGLEPCRFFQHAMLCKYLIFVNEGKACRY